MKNIPFILSIHALIILFAATESNILHAKADIKLFYMDTDNQGFNDTTPSTPVGGNTGTTLGEQRRIALRYAADILEHALSSSVAIEINTQFSSLGGNAFSAALAQTGPITSHFDFANAPLTNTLYVQALANKLAKADLSTSADIRAEFNADIDLDSILEGTTWYYGLDQSPPETSFDFVTVALHELLHGLGFITFMDYNNGSLFLNRDNSFDHFLYLQEGNPSAFFDMSNEQRLAATINTTNLLWNGPTGINQSIFYNQGVNNNRIQMYAPNPIEIGSSLSHVSSQMNPDDMMEPAYIRANHDLGLGAVFLSDMGWGNLTDLQIHWIERLDPSPIHQNVQYLALIANANAETAPDTELTYTLPPNTTVVSMMPEQGQCNSNDTHIICSLGPIAGRSALTVTIILQHNQVADVTHHTEINADIVDQVPSNNQDIQTTQIVNETPSIQAEAGANQLTINKQVVTLNAEASTVLKSNISIAAYQWQQISGATVNLNSENTSQTSFTSPNSSGPLVFKLTVTDNLGNTASDFVNISVNLAPSAHAGKNQSVRPETNVQLSAASSEDSDGNITHYLWEQISGEFITLNDNTAISPQFTAPTSDMTLIFKVTVTDNQGATDSSEVAVTIDSSLPLITNGNGGAVGLPQFFFLLLCYCILLNYKHINPYQRDENSFTFV